MRRCPLERVRHERMESDTCRSVVPSRYGARQRPRHGLRAVAIDRLWRGRDGRGGHATSAHLHRSLRAAGGVRRRHRRPCVRGLRYRVPHLVVKSPIQLHHSRIGNQVHTIHLLAVTEVARWSVSTPGQTSPRPVARQGTQLVHSAAPIRRSNSRERNQTASCERHVRGRCDRGTLAAGRATRQGREVWS